MTGISIVDIFNLFNDRQILIIGDIMIDSYVWGMVERISPEAPVPVVQVRKKEKRLGGAGNVAKNIQSLGAKPLLCSVIGNDPEAKFLLELMGELEMPTYGIISSNSRITTVKERFISGSQHILRVDDEQVHDLDLKEKKELKKRIERYLPECHAVIFEDYDKGVLDKEMIRFVIQLANDHKIPTIVDPKRKNFRHYGNATLFKPNLKEIREGMKIDLDKDDFDGLKKAVKLLREKLEVKSILATLSDKGVYYSSKDVDLQLPAHVRKIADVSGAGDTVISIAALCSSLGLPPDFTAALCNLGGGIVCEYPGVVAINRERLLEEAKVHGLSG